MSLTCWVAIVFIFILHYDIKHLYYICHVVKGLKQLEYLNLNFCQQLTGNICNYIRYCRNLEVLQLSGLEKLNDESIEMLLSDPMGCLTELDISHTAITDRSLEAIAKGQYHLLLHVMPI